MNVSLAIAVPFVALLVLAAVWDLRTRRIPNLLVAGALALALGAHLALQGGAGLAVAIGGAVIAGGLLLPGWLMGYTGAGDVKLMAAAGAWLGVTLGAMAVLFSLIAGGVIAVLVATRHGVFKQSVANAAALGFWSFARAGGPVPEVPTTGLRFPFALAILTGSLIALWVRS